MPLSRASLIYVKKIDNTSDSTAEYAGSEAELIGRIIQSEQKLTDYFTTIITKSVTEQLEQRNMIRIRMFGVVSFVLMDLIVRTAIANAHSSILGDRFTSRISFEEVLRKFQHYMDLSQHSQEFVRLLPLQMMVEASAGDKDAHEQIQALQLYVLDLSPWDNSRFIAETVRYSNPDYRDAPDTSRNRRIGGATGRLVFENANFFTRLLQDDAVKSEIEQLANIEANRENMGIATALTAFRRIFVKGIASGRDPDVKRAISSLVVTDIYVPGWVPATSFRRLRHRTAKRKITHQRSWKISSANGATSSSPANMISSLMCWIGRCPDICGG